MSHLSRYCHYCHCCCWYQTQESNVEIIQIPANDSGAIDVAALERELVRTQHSPIALRIGSFSAASNVRCCSSCCCSCCSCSAVLVLVVAVSSRIEWHQVTGIMSDVVGITVLLHKYGALSFWDYASAAPHVDIDMNPVSATSATGDASVATWMGSAAYIDAIFVSPHKFVGGPDTPGTQRHATPLASMPIHCSDLPIAQ